MKELLVWLTTWRRPELLARTLPTLRESLAGIDCDVFVTVNECDPQTAGVLVAQEWLDPRHIRATAENRGLVLPVYEAVPMMQGYRYVLLTEDDGLHRIPKREYIQLLEALPFLGAVSGHRQTRWHPTYGSFPFDGRRWHLVRETGTLDFLTRPELLARLGPPPDHSRSKIVLDTWICNTDRNSLTPSCRPIAVCDNGTEDIGAELSTWHGPSALPEFAGRWSKPA